MKSWLAVSAINFAAVVVSGYVGSWDILSVANALFIGLAAFEAGRKK